MAKTAVKSTKNLFTEYCLKLGENKLILKKTLDIDWGTEFKRVLIAFYE